MPKSNNVVNETLESSAKSRPNLQLNHKSRTRSFFEENKILLIMLFVVFLLAVISYTVAEWNEMEVHTRELRLIPELRTSTASNEDLAVRLQTELESINRRNFWAQLSHHLSLAFLISFITIVAVEFHTRKLMRDDLDEHLEEIKQNVWQALGKRFLGPKIAAEIEAIMKEDAAKSDCSYVITFKPLPDPLPHGFPPDRVIVLIENFYKVRNLAGTAGKTHPIRNSISSFEKLDVYPRFTRFDVNEESKIKTAVSKNILELTVPLPEEEDTKVAVAVAMEIVYKLRGSETFITEIAAEKLDITVANQIPEKIKDISVDLIHGSGHLEHPANLSWRLERALLPGQGFVLNWSDTLDVTTSSLPTSDHILEPVTIISISPCLSQAESPTVSESPTATSASSTKQS